MIATQIAAGAHALAHPQPLADCPWCPDTACRCGRTSCPQASEHRRAHAASETTWRRCR